MQVCVECLRILLFISTQKPHVKPKHKGLIIGMVVCLLVCTLSREQNNTLCPGGMSATLSHKEYIFLCYCCCLFLYFCNFVICYLFIMSIQVDNDSPLVLTWKLDIVSLTLSLPPPDTFFLLLLYITNVSSFFKLNLIFIGTKYEKNRDSNFPSFTFFFTFSCCLHIIPMLLLLFIFYIFFPSTKSERKASLYPGDCKLKRMVLYLCHMYNNIPL